MARNIVPRTNKGADLGTPAKNWNTVYADKVVANIVQGENLKAVEQSAGDEITLRSLIASAGSDPMSITVYDDIPITDDLIIPSNIELYVKIGGKLSIDAAKTLTINGPFSAGLYQVFSGDGNVHFSKGVVPYVVPHWWGADPTGIVSSAAAFQVAVTTNHNVFIPAGSYLIDDEIILPNSTNLSSIRGVGAQTILRLELATGKYCFTNITNFVGGLVISDMAFEAATTNYDFGAIGLEKGLRGISIENIWTRNLENPIYLGNGIWGLCSLQNIWLYYLGKKERATSVGIHAKGNTIFMRNIEVTGGFNKGIFLEGTAVGNIIGFNVAGSSMDDKLYEGIVVVNGGQIRLSDGWFEQFDLGYGNGEAPAVKVDASRNLTIDNINVAAGSIYLTGTTQVLVNNIHFGNSMGGFKVGKGTTVNLGNISHYNKLPYGYWSPGRGRVNVIDQGIGRRRPGRGLSNNPTLLSGISSNLSVTNVSLASFSNETTDYLTGNRAIKVNVNTDFHGAQLTWKGLSPDIYTIVAYIKVISGVSGIYCADLPYNIGTRNAGYPLEGGDASNSEWQRVSIVMSPNDVGTIRVQFTVTKTGTEDAIFLIDSAEIYRGFQSNLESLLEFDHRKDYIFNSGAPTAGTWAQGDIVWNSSPVAGGTPGWICTQSGTFSGATDTSGDTDGSTATITGMTDTSDFAIGDYVNVSAGFPTTGPYRVIAITSTTMTLEANSNLAATDITVSTSDPVFKSMPILEG